MRLAGLRAVLRGLQEPDLPSPAEMVLRLERAEAREARLAAARRRCWSRSARAKAPRVQAVGMLARTAMALRNR